MRRRDQLELQLEDLEEGDAAAVPARRARRLGPGSSTLQHADNRGQRLGIHAGVDLQPDPALQADLQPRRPRRAFPGRRRGLRHVHRDQGGRLGRARRAILRRPRPRVEKTRADVV